MGSTSRYCRLHFWPRIYVVAAKYINYFLILAVVLSVVIFYGYRFLNKQHHVFQKISYLYIGSLTLSLLFHLDLYQTAFLRVGQSPILIMQFILSFQCLWNPIGIRLAVFFSTFGNPIVVITLLLVLVLFLLINKKILAKPNFVFWFCVRINL